MEKENIDEEGAVEDHPEDYLNEDYDPNALYNEEEEEFIKVSEVLARNDRFGHFSSDFQKLMASWQAAHKREVYFAQQSRSLRKDTVEMASKLNKNAAQMSSDIETIERLKSEIIRAWKMVDAAHAREQASQEVLDSLQTQVSKLSQELELNKKSTDQDQEAGALAKNKEALLREKDRLMAELLVAKGKLSKAGRLQKEFEERLEQSDTKISRLNTELEALKNDISKERRFKDMLNEDLANLKEMLSNKNKEIQNQQSAALTSAKTIQTHEHTMKEQRVAIDKLVKELQDMTAAQKTLKFDIEQQQANSLRLSQLLDAKCQDYKLKEEEFLRVKLDEQKLRKTKENLQKKLALHEGQKLQADVEKGKMQAKISGLDRELNDLKKFILSEKKAMEALTREKELVARAALKATALSDEQKASLTLQTIQQKRLEGDVVSREAEISRLQKELKESQEDRAALDNELTETKRRLEETLERVRLKEGEVTEQKKKVEDGEMRMKLNAALFEQVRAERNKVSKSLVEAQDEIRELSHKLKVKSYEVEQLKDDITAKETMLIKGEFNLQKVTKEKESLRLEKLNLSGELREAKNSLTMCTQEEKRLTRILEATEEEKNKLAKEYNQLFNDQVNLTAQLSNKSEEARLLREKTEILEETLNRGEAQYLQRIEDIKLLKIEIKRLKQEKALMTRSLGNAANVHKEMLHLEKRFTRERLKSRALEEEMANPLNVHRWRRLEGADPPTYELIQKVRLLQKRLITAKEEAILRDAQLEEVKKNFEAVKSAMGKQPGCEIAEKLHLAHITIREKTEKIKALTAEISMFESEISECKLDLEHKSKEVAKFKRKYFALKRRDQKSRERDGAETDQGRNFLPRLESVPPTTAKFVGGGFNIAPPYQKMST